MERNKISEIFAKLGLVVKIITFLEDGYEIIASSDEESDVDEVHNVNIEGFSVVSINKRNLMYTILIVPISLEEMTDYIWRYVERYGDKGDRLIEILGDAVCSLERTIETIPNELARQKKIAKGNFDKFTNQIF